MKTSTFLSMVTAATGLGFSVDARALTCNTTSACEVTMQNGTGQGFNVFSRGSGETIYAENLGGGTGVSSFTTANATGKAAGFFTTNAGSSSTAVAAENGSSGTGLYASSNGGFAGYFSGNVTITGTCNGCGSGSSDIRLKKNVKPITGALEQLLQLRGVTFEWIDPTKHGNEMGTQRGFIAQEVEKVFPNWVREGNDGFKVLDYRQTEALEVESIRALKAENDDLKARVKALEDSRRPVVSMNANGLGLAIGGIAIAGVLASSRRKREQEQA